MTTAGGGDAVAQVLGARAELRVAAPVAAVRTLHPASAQEDLCNKREKKERKI